MKTLEEIRERQKLSTRRRRLLILQNYSGSIIPFCNCCGEKELKFLVLDHINGGGTKHRKEITKEARAGGSAIYGWIVKNNFPAGFQVLCHNCNQAKSFYGGCPHKI